MGTKARPFYRVVVAQGTAGRDGAFVEIIGTYNPLTKPHAVSIKEDRALHWLSNGAQPTETVAYLLKEQGILDTFFASRPAAKQKYKTLDKRTDSMAKKSVVSTPTATLPKAPEAALPAIEQAPAEVPVEVPEPAHEVNEVSQPPQDVAENAPATNEEEPATAEL